MIASFDCFFAFDIWHMEIASTTICPLLCFTDVVVDVGLSIVVAVADDNYHHAEINSVFHYTQL